MSFLPVNYDVPSSQDKYMKFQKGENRFRILTSPILGYEIWEDVGDKRVPHRTPLTQPFTSEEAPNPEDIKHFWALVVYNYANQKVQILEITQKGIQKTLRSLAADPDWGSPVQKYDIVVTRTGEGLETTYSVLPKPGTIISKEILDKFNEVKINLEALFVNEDPFTWNGNEVVDVPVEEIESGIEKLRKAVPTK